MKNRVFFLSIFIFFSCFLFSCKENSNILNNRVYLTSGWKYSDVGGPAEFYDLPNDDLTHLSSLLENRTGYIFLKKNFTLPQSYKHKDFGLFVGRLKIASKVYINDNLIGQSGFFPPHEFTEGERSSYYKVPKDYINFSGTNTITICIWCHDYGTIRSVPFFSDYEDIVHKAEFDNLVNSKIYMIFSVVLLIVFLIYFFLYVLRRSEKENLSFAVLCLSTAFYLLVFYIGEYSVIYKNKYSFLLFEKVFNGAAPLLTCYCIINFTRDFLGYKEKTFGKAFRLGMTVFAVGLMCMGSDIVVTRKLLRIGFIIMIILFIFPIKIIVISIKNKEKKILHFILGFVPIYFSLLVQAIAYLCFKKNVNSLMLASSWIIVIFLFLSMLIIRFVNLANKVEYMNKNLEQLVSDRTEALEKEKNRALQEIELAGFVQKSFYKIDTSELKDWELNIAFKAMAGVSGDLYIVFMSENKLDGIGIFDISGHGIASGLVTMLVKNIIEQEFRKGIKKPLNEVMTKINDRIITEKGSIENYLTGMLIRFNKDNYELVNAGHPKAILYKSQAGEVAPIEQEGINQFGAIGIPDFPINFETVKFNMNKGDELVLYTDGITECTNSEKQYFGVDGVLSVFKENIWKNVESQVNALPAALEKFSGTDNFNDDITYIILKKLV